MKTDVIFLRENDDSGNIFAYFPSIEHDTQGNKLSYSTIGQHSPCAPMYAMECKETKYKEWHPLYNELKSLGYDLNVLTTQSVELHRNPTKTEIKRGFGSIHYKTFRLSDLLKPDGTIKTRHKCEQEKLFYYR